MRTPLLGIGLAACLASPLALAQANGPQPPRSPVGRAMANFTSLLREASTHKPVPAAPQRDASAQAPTAPANVATTSHAGTASATQVGADPAAVDQPEMLEQANTEGVP